jgi:transposase
VTGAVHEVWQRLTGSDPDERLKRDGRLVLRAREHLTVERWRRLSAVLRRYRPLRNAYLLKEDFRRWYRCCSPPHARLGLQVWRRTLGELSDLTEFHDLSGMFDRWQEEILNYFSYRTTQGFGEGTNNRAKVFEPRAYGYRNMANLRRHLLLPG